MFVAPDTLTSGALTFAVQEPLMDIPPPMTDGDVNFAVLINGLRRGDGLPNLTFDSRLDAAAQQHAQDMVDNDFFDHNSLDGRTPEERIIAEGYVPTISGENIAAGQQSDEGVFAAWQSSESHDALMRLDGVEDFALGVAGDGQDTRWVLVVASEQ